MLLCDVLLCFSFDSYFTFARSYIIKKALLHCKCVGPKIKTFSPIVRFCPVATVFASVLYNITKSFLEIC